MSSEPDVDGARGRRWRKPRREAPGSTASPVVQVSDEEFVRAAALAQLDTLVSTPIASAAVRAPSARVERSAPEPEPEPEIDAGQARASEPVEPPAGAPPESARPARPATPMEEPAEAAGAPETPVAADPAGAAAQAAAEDKQDDVLARVAAYSRITMPQPPVEPAETAETVEPEPVAGGGSAEGTGEEPVPQAHEQVEPAPGQGADDVVSAPREARIAHRAVAAAEARARVADTVAAEQAELARQAAEERDAAAARLAELEAAVGTQSQALERAEADREAATQAERRQREIAAAAEAAAAEAAADADERVAAAEAAAEAAAREAAETVLALRRELAAARGEEPPAAPAVPEAPVAAPAGDSAAEEVASQDDIAEIADIAVDDTEDVAEDNAEDDAEAVTGDDTADDTADDVAAEVSVEELEVEAAVRDDESPILVEPEDSVPDEGATQAEPEVREPDEDVTQAEAEAEDEVEVEAPPTPEDESPGLEARRPEAPHTSTTDEHPSGSDPSDPAAEDEDYQDPSPTSVEPEPEPEPDAEARAERLTVRPSDLLPDHGPAVVAAPVTALSRAWRRVRGKQQPAEDASWSEVVVPPVPALGSRSAQATRPETPESSAVVPDEVVEEADAEASPTPEDDSPGLEARRPEAPHTSTTDEEPDAEASSTTDEEADAEASPTPEDESPGLEARRPGAPHTSTTVNDADPEASPTTVEDAESEASPTTVEDVEEEPETGSSPERDALAALPAHVVRTATVSGASREPYTARRRGGSGFVGALLAVAGVVTIVTLAIGGTLDVPLGVGLGVASFLAALFAYRRIGRSSTVTLSEEGVLTLVFGDAQHIFDLSTDATDLEMIGYPGDARWAVRLIRRGLSPLEVDAGSVDPMLFTEALRQWRPDL